MAASITIGSGMRSFGLTALAFLAGIAAGPVQAAAGGKNGTNAGTPTISSSPPRQVVAGSPYDYRPVASDPNGDPLTFRISSLPRWASFDTRTGRLWGTPVLQDVGRLSLTIYVSDGTLESSQSYNLRVAAGSPPVISGTPSTSATEGVAYSFQPTASDPDGQTLTYAIVNRPAWASFDAATGRLSGTPPTGSAGTYGSIGISVTDGASTASLAPFSITVSAPKNNPPTISGTPATTVEVGQAYDFRPTASDADGDPLRFYVVNAPGFLTFDAATGRLSGTPPTGSEGSYADILISVGDGKDVTFLPMFTLTVSTPPPAQTVNTVPTISGTPATSVTAGNAYAFQPTAYDPDGQVLAFGIANKPAWASFDKATGRLSGTPATTDANTYSNIVISVSDGIASTTLPAFSITVVAPPPPAATLTWTTPTQNDDGTPLTNLAGFKIRYGTSPTSLTQVVDIPSAAVTSASIEGLSTGTWYFTVSAYGSTGIESAPTGLVSYSVQ